MAVYLKMYDKQIFWLKKSKEKCVKETLPVYLIRLWHYRLLGVWGAHGNKLAGVIHTTKKMITKGTIE
jgi:hypothetical protein